MIKAIGQAQAGRIDPARVQATADGKPVARAEAAGRVQGGEAEESAIGAIVAAGPPVDAARVARIKAQIADGSYTVDPRRIADKMIELDLRPAT